MGNSLLNVQRDNVQSTNSFGTGQSNVNSDSEPSKGRERAEKEQTRSCEGNITTKTQI